MKRTAPSSPQQQRHKNQDELNSDLSLRWEQQIRENPIKNVNSLSHLVQRCRQLLQQLQHVRKNSDNGGLEQSGDGTELLQLLMVAIRATFRSVRVLMRHGMMVMDQSIALPNKNGNNVHHEDSVAKLKLKRWVRSRFEVFMVQVIVPAMQQAHLVTIDATVEMLRLSMQNVRLEWALFLGAQTRRETQSVLDLLKSHTFTRHILKTMVHMREPNEQFERLVFAFREHYFARFSDVRFFTFAILCDMIKDHQMAEKSKSKRKKTTKRKEEEEGENVSTELFCQNVMTLVDTVVVPAESKEFFFVMKRSELDAAEQGVEHGDVAEERSTKKRKLDTAPQLPVKSTNSLEEQRRQFSKFWLAFLQIKEMPVSIYEVVLVRMDKFILPHFDNPFLLNDFVLGSFDRGGLTALLSVNALFILIAKYNLVYPKFFDRLYSIIDVNMFYLPYRRKFQNMLTKFLSSPLLPNYMVSSFAKKLARISLFAPPYAAIYCIVLVFDLLNRNPETQVLIHRTKPVSSGGALALNLPLNESKMPVVFSGQDPFRFNEKDLTKTMAAESSLWEIETLKQHYNVTVAEYATRFMDKWRQDATFDEIRKVGGQNPDMKNLDKRIVFPRPDIFSNVTFDSMVQDELAQNVKAKTGAAASKAKRDRNARQQKNNKSDVIEFEYQRRDALFGDTESDAINPYEWFKI